MSPLFPLSPLTDAALVAAATCSPDFNQRFELLAAIGQRLCGGHGFVPPYVEGAYLIEVPV